MDSGIRLDDLWGPGGNRTGDAAVREILRQSIRLFGRRGYEGASMRTIAAEASVTAPLIGYHFGSKEGLFSACVALVLSSTSDMMRVDAPEDPSIEAFVRAFARAHVDFSRNFPEALRFILTVVYGPEESLPRVDVMHFWRPVIFDLLQRFETALARGEITPRSGATAPRLVRHLLNLVHMEIMSAYEHERFVCEDPEMSTLFEEESADALTDDLVAQFFHGAGGLRVAEPEEHDS